MPSVSGVPSSVSRALPVPCVGTAQRGSAFLPPHPLICFYLVRSSSLSAEQAGHGEGGGAQGAGGGWVIHARGELHYLAPLLPLPAILVPVLLAVDPPAFLRVMQLMWVGPFLGRSFLPQLFYATTPCPSSHRAGLSGRLRGHGHPLQRLRLPGHGSRPSAVRRPWALKMVD
jgi:hypothetical protein